MNSSRLILSNNANLLCKRGINYFSIVGFLESNYFDISIVQKFNLIHFKPKSLCLPNLCADKFGGYGKTSRLVDWTMVEQRFLEIGKKNCAGNNL